MSTDIAPKEPTVVSITLEQVLSDVAFKPILEKQIQESLYPPIPPAGMKYVRNTHIYLRDNGFNDPDRIMSEFMLISIKKSIQPVSARDFIIGIVKLAIHKTILDIQKRKSNEQN